MRETLSSLIRRAIEESGESRYAIACKCGVQQSTLSRFMLRQGQISLETADKLIAGLGIEVKYTKKGE
jgi:transcriptional regulator with XRE-family HTH domain